MPFKYEDVKCSGKNAEPMLRGLPVEDRLADTKPVDELKKL